jgi:hypothetical protein
MDSDSDEEQYDTSGKEDEEMEPRPTSRKISHRDFRLILVRKMLARAGHEPRPSRAVGRPALASVNVSRLHTPQQTLAGPQPDQEAMSRMFRARCKANGEV